MWYNYSPPNAPDTFFNYMQGGLSIMVQKNHGNYYVSCNQLGIVGKRINASGVPAVKKKAVEMVMEAAAEIVNACNEAIDKIA
jgi:hypothetical protein